MIGQHPGGQHRLQQQGGGDRHQQREGDGQGLVPEEGAGDARDVNDREENGHRGQGGGEHGPGHFGGAALGRHGDRLPA